MDGFPDSKAILGDFWPAVAESEGVLSLLAEMRDDEEAGDAAATGIGDDAGGPAGRAVAEVLERM